MATKKASKKTQNSNSVSFEQVVERAKEVVYAGLGVYGKAYDEIQSRVESMRGDSNNEWNSLVARGESMHKQFNEKVENFDGEFTFEIPVYVELDDIRERLETLRANIDEKFEDLKTRFQPA